eukprot:scaffold511_cov62-Cyclotella_meneghiniana.AAC.3
MGGAGKRCLITLPSILPGNYQEINLTRPPLLSGLVLRAPSGALLALPICRSLVGVGLRLVLVGFYRVITG